MRINSQDIGVEKEIWEYWKRKPSMGILETDTIKQAAMKEKIEREYF